jgi:hypothetical protein
VTILGQIPEISIEDASNTQWKMIEGGAIQFEAKSNDEKAGA